MKKKYFITGGTGSFGQKFAEKLIEKNLAKKIIIFSRDEFKQSKLKERDFVKKNLNIFRFYIGDVRDKSRLEWAMHDDTDVVIHTAALKQVPTTEYNPFETVKTNIFGTQNLIEVSIKKNVNKFLLISTDKAVSPINLYGATKLTAEKLTVSANLFKGKRKCMLSVVRYGNVMGSRGSVIPLLLKQNENPRNNFTITDKRMTRFNITLDEAGLLVLRCLKLMRGGEVFVPKLPSYNIITLAKSINKNKKIQFIGIRQGEKLHEELVSVADLQNCIENKDIFIVYPSNFKLLNNNKKDILNSYNSYTNKKYLTEKDLKELIKNQKIYFEN